MSKRHWIVAIAIVVIALLVACAPAPTPTPQVVKETVMVPVTVTVPQTVIVLQTVTPAATKVVTTTLQLGSAGKLDTTPRIAILGAYAPEWSQILKDMTDQRVLDVNGTVVYLGKLSGQDVAAALLKVSMTNAASTYPELLDALNIQRAIVLGVSGGVDANVADVVVSAKWATWDEVHYAKMIVGKWDLAGEEKKCVYGNYGPMFVCAVNLLKPGGKPGELETKFWFETDPVMLQIAKGLVGKVNLQQCAPDKNAVSQCLKVLPKMVVGGTGVSGSAFVDNPELRAWIFANPAFEQPKVLDMETSAVYQVSYRRGVPVIAFRPPSDLAGADVASNPWATFDGVAAVNGALVVEAFLKELTPANLATAAPKPTEAPKPTVMPTAAPKPTEATKPIMFGIVLVGPYNDHGWSEAHYTAAQYVKSKLPGSDFIYLDKVNSADRPGTTLEQVVNEMKSRGVKLVITTSDDFQTDTITIAPKFPDITFINASGDSAWKDGKNYKDIKNLGNFMGKMEYMKMVAGCSAALSTQTGKIGFLGPLINDETRRLADAAYLGAKYCWTTYAKKNAADLKFDVKWIGFWFNIPGVTLDPTKVATDFFNAGNDVVISGLDTTEALVVAGQRQAKGEKVWAVSYDFKDGCNEAPNACLGVPYFNWGPAYLKTVKDFQAGTWKPAWDWNGPDWSNLDNPDTGAVGFTFGKGMTDANKATVQLFIKGLADSSINLWKGPVTLQDGTVYIKAGAIATDKEIWYLPQLLQGMTGQSAPTK